MNRWHFSGMPVRKSTNLQRCVSHHVHQVVSLPLLQRSAESLFLFFFDEGEGISKDIQQSDLLYLVVEGDVEFIVNQTSYTLHTNQIILVPAYVAHSVDAQRAVWLLQLAIGEERILKTMQTKGNYIKNIQKETVLNMKELVEYQADKIASLTLIQRETYTTTIMAMAQGTGVGPHICEGDAMVVALDGVGQVMIDEKIYVVREGECIVMPAGISHAVRGEEGNFKMMLIVSKPVENDNK